MLRPVLASILVLVGLTACQTTASGTDGPCDANGPSIAGGTSHTLVILRTGPRTEPLSKEESSRHFAGHFANMTRLANEGDLLLAGPYGSNKSAEDLRGIFVLDTADRARALELANTDPCYQAGIFKFEFHTMRTHFPLDQSQAAERARLDAAKRAGKETPPGFGCRGYVMVTVADHNRATALASHDSVYLYATLDDGRALAFVDCTNQQQAEQLLAPLREQLGELTIDEWFGTDLLAAEWL